MHRLPAVEREDEADVLLEEEPVAEFNEDDDDDDDDDVGEDGLNWNT